MIRGITFSDQAFYSKDFAHFQHFFLNGDAGITKGCTVTHDDTTVTIGKGYFIAHGRMMCIEEAETVVASQGFASGYNRIVYEIDLSKENTVTDFRQGYIKVLNSETLIQEDLDDGGNVYQFPFCHFQWSGSAITAFTIDAPSLDTTRVKTYTAQVGTAWTDKTGYYTQDISVEGIKAADNPIVDLVASTAGFESEQEVYMNIFKIVTSDGKITVYSSKATTTAISIQLKVVK